MFFERFPRLLRKPILRLFDLKKKRDMEMLYKRDKDAWGRSGYLDQASSAVKLVSDKRYRRCLDVGTGLGIFAEHAAKMCDEVVAVDISDEAVRRAQERIGGLKNIKFVAGNVRTMEFESGFDLIIFGEVLFYFGDKFLPDEFFQTLKRFTDLLERGGRILITHNVRPWRDRAWFYEKYINALKRLGMTLELEDEFKKDKRIWLHAVLKK